MTAYKDNEVPDYEHMSAYDEKVVCTNIYDKTGVKYWSKAIMYGILGISQ